MTLKWISEREWVGGAWYWKQIHETRWVSSNFSVVEGVKYFIIRKGTMGGAKEISSFAQAFYKQTRV